MRLALRLIVFAIGINVLVLVRTYRETYSIICSKPSALNYINGMDPVVSMEAQSNYSMSIIDISSELHLTCQARSKKLLEHDRLLFYVDNNQGICSHGIRTIKIDEPLKNRSHLTLHVLLSFRGHYFKQNFIRVCCFLTAEHHLCHVYNFGKKPAVPFIRKVYETNDGQMNVCTTLRTNKYLVEKVYLLFNDSSPKIPCEVAPDQGCPASVDGIDTFLCTVHRKSVSLLKVRILASNILGSAHSYIFSVCKNFPVTMHNNTTKGKAVVTWNNLTDSSRYTISSNGTTFVTYENSVRLDVLPGHKYNVKLMAEQPSCNRTYSTIRFTPPDFLPQKIPMLLPVYVYVHHNYSIFWENLPIQLRGSINSTYVLNISCYEGGSVSRQLLVEHPSFSSVIPKTEQDCQIQLSMNSSVGRNESLKPFSISPIWKNSPFGDTEQRLFVVTESSVKFTWRKVIDGYFHLIACESHLHHCKTEQVYRSVSGREGSYIMNLSSSYKLFQFGIAFQAQIQSNDFILYKLLHIECIIDSAIKEYVYDGEPKLSVTPDSQSAEVVIALLCQGTRSSITFCQLLIKNIEQIQGLQNQTVLFDSVQTEKTIQIENLHPSSQYTVSVSCGNNYGVSSAKKHQFRTLKGGFYFNLLYLLFIVILIIIFSLFLIRGLWKSCQRKKRNLTIIKEVPVSSTDAEMEPILVQTASLNIDSGIGSKYYRQASSGSTNQSDGSSYASELTEGSDSQSSLYYYTPGYVETMVKN